MSGTSAPRSMLSPDDQKVSFAELFFDLVFVFCVTQVVHHFEHGLSLASALGAGLIFWIVWWAWTQFTWALNAADTTHPHIVLATLAATAVAFFMAIAIPEAFHGRAPWFAVPYVAVRLIGLGLYEIAARESPSLHRAVGGFALLSLSGLVAVLVGAWLGGAAQYLLWGLAILLDMTAAMRAGSARGWNLHTEHFSERHGLFIIIALGEGLIVAAGGLSGVHMDARAAVLGLLAVSVICGFWWSHFIRAKPRLDAALEDLHEDARAGLARDAFSLGHFPVVCGVIAFAAGLEHVLGAHAGEMARESRILLAVGFLLFVGGMAPALYRATRAFPVARFVIALTTAAIIFFSPWGAIPMLSIAFAGVALVSLVER